MYAVIDLMMYVLSLANTVYLHHAGAPVAIHIHAEPPAHS